MPLIRVLGFRCIDDLVVWSNEGEGERDESRGTQGDSESGVDGSCGELVENLVSDSFINVMYEGVKPTWPLKGSLSKSKSFSPPDLSLSWSGICRAAKCKSSLYSMLPVWSRTAGELTLGHSYGTVDEMSRRQKSGVL